MRSALRNAPQLVPLQDLLLQRIDQRGRVRLHAFTGQYGAALQELGRVGHVPLMWLESLPRVTRSALVADLLESGVITERDLDYAAVFLAWLPEYFETEASELTDAHRKAIQQYARWHLARNQRVHTLPLPRARMQLRNHRSIVRCIGRFFMWLQSRDRAFAMCNGRDLDAYGFHEDVFRFVRWAKRKGLTRAIAPVRTGKVLPVGQASAIRAKRVQQLYTDEEMPLWIRVAGLLSYHGLRVYEMVQLRPEHVLPGSPVRLQLEKSIYTLPPKLGELVMRMSNEQPPTVSRMYRTRSPWLFPGRFEGRPRSAQTVYHALSKYDMRATSSRNSFFIGISQRLTWLAVTMSALGLHHCQIASWRASSNGKYAQYFGSFRRPLRA